MSGHIKLCSTGNAAGRKESPICVRPFKKFSVRPTVRIVNPKGLRTKGGHFDSPSPLTQKPKKLEQ